MFTFNKKMTGHAKDNNDEDDDYDWTEDKSAPTDVSRGKLSQFERLCICNVALFKTTPLANSRKDQLLYQRKLSKPWMIPMIRGHFQTLTKNHGVRKKPHKFHDFAGHWTKDSSDVTNNTPSVFSNFVDFGPKFGRGAIAREEWVWAKYNRSRKRRQLTPTLLPWTVVRWKYKYTNVMKNNNMDLPINVNSWLVY